MFVKLGRDTKGVNENYLGSVVVRASSYSLLWNFIREEDVE